MRCRAAERVVRKARPSPVRLAALLGALATFAGAPAQALAGSSPDEGRLAAAMSALRSYELDGPAMEALAELRRLSESLDRRVAATARLLRAGAAVELLVYSRLAGDDALVARIALALRVGPRDVEHALDRELQHAARTRAFAGQASANRVVLSCLEPDADWSACAPRLRRVARSGHAGATAARLLLVDRVARAAGAARGLPPGQAAAALVTAAGTLCASSPDEALRSACELAAEGAPEAQAAVVEALIGELALDLRALDAAGAAGDPLARLASELRERALEAPGSLALVGPLGEGCLEDVSPPRATARAAPTPPTVLVVGRSRVSVGLAPTTIVGPRGVSRLDERAGLGLPGAAVLSLPARFPGVIRPIPELVAALERTREAFAAAVSEQTAGEPPSMEWGPEALGLVVDRSVSLVDLSRFVASARQAGFRSFALVGLRDDGRLAVIPAEFAARTSGPAAPAVPRLSVGPTEVTLWRSSGATERFQRASGLERLGRSAADDLGAEDRVFALEGRPMMPYGVVFPSLDAVAAAGADSARCRFLLPQ